MSNHNDETMSSTCTGEPSSQHQRPPVIIPIHCRNTGNNDDDVPEWAMIEVNGELLLPLEVASSDTDEVSSTEPSVSISNETIELGALSFHDKIPILIVGTHELRGVIEELSEPFVCLQAVSENNATRYAVTGVVRRKLLFNQYPKTLLR